MAYPNPRPREKQIFAEPRCASSNNRRPALKLSPRTMLVNNQRKVASLRHVSPFQMITSERSIGTSSLPGFLRIEHSGDINKPKPNNLSIKIQKRGGQSSNTNSPPITPNYKNKKGLIPDPKEFLTDSCMRERFILRIGKIELISNDLGCLQPEVPVKSNVIDACLKLFKKNNKQKILSKRKSLHSLYVFSTSQAENIFSGTSELNISKNLRKFEYFIYSNLCFPIYVGYWTLLICNLYNKSIVYYDPIGIESEEKSIKTRLFIFLKSHIGINDHVLRNLFLKKLKYEEFIESEVYDHVDSGVYIIMQALSVAADKTIQIKPERITDYRRKLLHLLFKHGVKVAI